MFRLALAAAAMAASPAVAGDLDELFLDRVGLAVAVSIVCPALTLDAGAIRADADQLGVAKRLDGPKPGEFSLDVLARAGEWRKGLIAIGPDATCAFGRTLLAPGGAMGMGYVKG